MNDVYKVKGNYFNHPLVANLGHVQFVGATLQGLNILDTFLREMCKINSQ